MTTPRPPSPHDCHRGLRFLFMVSWFILGGNPLVARADEPSMNDATGTVPPLSAADPPKAGAADPPKAGAADPPKAGAIDADPTEPAREDNVDDAAVFPIHMIGPGKRPPDSLQPLIAYAQNALDRFQTEVDAYTCLLVKRETLEEGLEPTQYIRLKIRERRVDGDRLIQPQSLYAKFLKPNEVAGREILYVENQRDGDLLVRRGGTRLPNLTLELKPDGRLAKQQSNYSVLQTGIRPMLEQILERMESKIDPANVQIRYFADAKVDGRPCQHIEVSQIKREPDSTFQVAKVYIDHELELPVYFSSYAWSDELDGEPVLQEQYALTKIDLHAKLSDLDFDRTNPAYQFRPEEKDEETHEDTVAD